MEEIMTVFRMSPLMVLSYNVGSIASIHGKGGDT